MEGATGSGSLLPRAVSRKRVIISLAYEDVSLGIPNLSALIREIESVIPYTDKSLYLVDINQFGTLNDILGHIYGDLVLESFVLRLKQAFPEGAFIARVSGDVFGIIGPRIEFSELQNYFRAPIDVSGGVQQISVSIGCLDLDDESLSGSDYLINANIALKRAKSDGLGKSVRYNPSIGLQTRERIKLLQELKSAFTHEKMFLMYQPQVMLNGGAPLGFEALMRWKTGEGQFISPSDFIPLAEQGGLIVPMGTWILRMALHTLSEIHKAGYPDLQMAINVSAIQLRNPDFLSILKQALADTKVNPHRVELEITESVAVLGVEQVVRLFLQIKAMGVSIAIDDFGTGYSSLSSIDRWPADRLKIDSAFVSRIDKHKPGGRIVDLVIPLGQKLGMKVLAEGIETVEQADHLKKLGCLEGQGYLYGRPMVYEDALQWLRKSKS
jgi:diguanylate cyclase (GGDEF)-like protein